MKATGTVLIIAFLFALNLTAQHKSDKLVGYWMESETDQINSLSTLLVFDKNDIGEVEGVVFFMESNDHTRKFPLSRIMIDGNAFSFIVKNTTISFFGKINEQNSGFSGSFLLEGNTSVTVTHQKLDSARIQSLIQQKSHTPRKEIDHTNGILIG